MLSPRLVKDMTIAANVKTAFESRADSVAEGGSWGAWEIDVNNKELVPILKAAHESYTSGE